MKRHNNNINYNLGNYGKKNRTTRFDNNPNLQNRNNLATEDAGEDVCGVYGIKQLIQISE